MSQVARSLTDTNFLLTELHQTQASPLLELRVTFDFDLNINISTYTIDNKDIQTSGGCAIGIRGRENSEI